MKLSRHILLYLALCYTVLLPLFVHARTFDLAALSSGPLSTAWNDFYCGVKEFFGGSSCNFDTAEPEAIVFEDKTVEELPSVPPQQTFVDEPTTTTDTTTTDNEIFNRLSSIERQLSALASGQYVKISQTSLPSQVVTEAISSDTSNYVTREQLRRSMDSAVRSSVHRRGSDSDGEFDSLTVGTLTGVLVATNGSVSATSSLSIEQGGTGVTTSPTYGQLLVGNGLGGYTLTATSSLGVTTSAGGSDTQVQYNNAGVFAGSASLTFNSTLGKLSTTYASTTALTTSGSSYLATSGGRVGIGTTDPYTTLTNYSSNIFDSSGFGLLTTQDSFSWSASGAGYIAAIENRDSNSTVRNGLLVKTAATDSASYVARFESGNINRLSIRADGNVGVGTTSPWRAFSVYGTSDLGSNALAGNFTATSTTASVFPYASTTAVTVSGTNGFVLGSLNGPLQANNGAVSATTSVGVLYGGTGLSSAPAYGQLMVGNASGGYTLTSTSSLNIVGSQWTTSGSDIYYSGGNVGVGTSTPWAQLSVNPNGISGPAFAIGSTTQTLLSVSNTGAMTFYGGTAAYQKVTLNSQGGILSVNRGDQGSSAVQVALGIPDGVNAGTAVTSGGFFGWSTSASNAANASYDTRLSRIASGKVSVDTTSTGNSLGTLVALNVGVGSTTPWAQLSVNPNGISGPAFAVGSSTATNFVVTNGGNVGVGTTSPWGQLSVEQGSTDQTVFVVGDMGSTSPTLIANGRGWVGVGTTTPWQKFSVGGSAAIDGYLAVSTSTKVTVIGDISGNTRGLNALDIQSTRGGAAQVASGVNAVAIGTSITASGSNASAVGISNTATGDSSVAFGKGNTSGGSNAISVGQSNNASANNSIAFGINNTASGVNSVSVGGGSNTASGGSSAAFGYGNTAYGNLSSAIGYQNAVYAASSSVVGVNNSIDSSLGEGYSYVFGGNNVITQDGNTSSDYITIAGSKNLSFENYSTLIGYSNNSGGVGATAIGYDNTASGTDSLAVGRGNSVSQTRAGAFGFDNTVSGSFSNAFGYTNTVSNDNAIAVGYVNTVSGPSGAAVGYSNAASAAYTSAVGYDNTASAEAASAFGYGVSVSGSYSSGFGYLSTAAANNSTVIGRSNFTGSTGASSVIVGTLNNQSGGTLSLSTGEISGTVTATTSSPGRITSVFGILNSAIGRESSVFGYNNVTYGGAASSTLIGYRNSSSATNTIVLGTGITNDIANSVMIGPSNSAKIIVDSSGYLGIGTTSPMASLSVHSGQIVGTTGTASAPTFGFSTYSGSGLYLSNASNGDVSIASAGSKWFTVSGAGGYVDIGTGSGYPAIKINGREFAQEDDGATSVGIGQGYTNVSFQNGGKTTIPYASSTVLTTSGSAYFATNGGSVGIGTTSPYAQLALNARSNGTYTNTLFAIASSTPTATTTHIVVMAGGNVGMGTAAPTHSFTLSSTVSANSVDGATASGGKGLAFYNTTDQTSNYQRGVVYMDTQAGDNDFVIRTEKGGTGTQPGLKLFGNSIAVDTGSGRLGLNKASSGNFDILVQIEKPLNIYGDVRTTTNSTSIQMASFGSFTQTSGTSKNVGITSSFAPTSGSAKFINLDLNPTINQTGSATGDYTVLQIRPTVTASTGSNKYLIHAGTAASTDLFVLTEAGRLGIGTSSPWRAFSATGTVALSGLSASLMTSDAVCINSSTFEIVQNVGASNCLVSSARFKHDIESLALGLETVNALRPVSFKMNSTNEERVGFIAEEVYSVDPRFVFMESDGETPRGVRYEELTAVLALSIQELDDKFERINPWFGEEGSFNVQGNVCVDDFCITKEEFKALLQTAGDGVPVDSGNEDDDDTDEGGGTEESGGGTGGGGSTGGTDGTGTGTGTGTGSGSTDSGTGNGTDTGGTSTGTGTDTGSGTVGGSGTTSGGTDTGGTSGGTSDSGTDSGSGDGGTSDSGNSSSSSDSGDSGDSGGSDSGGGDAGGSDGGGDGGGSEA